MQEIRLNTPLTLTVPVSANRLTVSHEWGDILAANVTVSGTYVFTPNSIGVHTFIFSNGNTTITYPTNPDGNSILFNPTIDGDIKQTTRYKAADQYVTSTDFFAEHASLNVGTNAADFAQSERKVRYIINSFTRQNFGPYLGKTKLVIGDGGNSLVLPERLNRLISCKDTWGTDLTPLVEVLPDQNKWLQTRSRIPQFAVRPLGTLYDVDIKSDVTRDTRNFFTNKLDFILLGNWGWDWIPSNVTEASNLLLMDEYTGAGSDLNNWITAKKLDDFEIQYSNLSYLSTTTGNVTADDLLSGFITVEIGLA